MPGTFAIYMEGCPKILPAENFLKNNWNKFCRFGKKCYLCTPKWKTGHSKGWRDTTSSLKRLIFILYKKQVPRNTIYREALISFEIRKVSGQAKRYKKIIQWRVWSWLRMNASGRLNTCKSRGSMRVSNNLWWRPAQGCVTREQLARFWGITGGNAD